MNPIRIKAEDLAYDRWPEVLMAAGMDPSFFGGRNGPCPFCGGNDRYQWKNKFGGVYVCRSCTDEKYRSPMNMLMQHLGLDYRGACDYVRGHFGMKGDGHDHHRIERLPPPRVKSQAVDPAKALQRMQRHWDEARPVQPGDAVDHYLRRRVKGLQHIPDDIRCHPALDYWQRPNSLDGKPTLLGRFPAMLVRGMSPQGEFVQLHKTYLDSLGNKADVPDPKKTDVGVGSNNFALRLDWPNGDRLGVSEGIENGLAGSVLRGIPVWPCHCASVMERFELPDELRGHIKQLVIFADNDPPKQNGKRTGQEAAQALSDRMRKQGVRTLIMRSAKIGQDFDDLLCV